MNTAKTGPSYKINYYRVMNTLAKSKLLTYLLTNVMAFSKIRLYLDFQNLFIMIGKTRVFILMLLFSGATCTAQLVTNQVMLPCVGVSTAGVLTYSQSIGETAVEIFSTSGYVLTQGFQQPLYKISDPTVPDGTGVEVYPNPATNYIYVKLFGEKARKMNIEVISFNGTIASKMNLDFTNKYFIIQEIEFSKLTIGIYLVRITSDDGVINRIFKIEKM
jgi:hypothetical protein